MPVLPALAPRRIRAAARQGLHTGDRCARVRLRTQLRWPRGNRRARELAAARRVRAERSVEVLPQLNALPRPAPVPGARRELQHELAKAQGVVLGHDAPVLEAAHRIDGASCGQRAPRSIGIGRSHGEACVVARQVGREERIRLADARDAGKAKLRDEAVLERAEEPLHPPLGLRRVREDELDLELAQGATHLRRLARAQKLLLAAFAHSWRAEKDAVAVRLAAFAHSWRAEKDAVAVRIDRERSAVAGKNLAQELEVPRGVLLLAERAGEDPA